MIDFLAGGGAGALVELAVQRGIELEEIEALHVEPLVKEAGDEFVGAGIRDEAIDLGQLGVLHITRASHVEPDELGQWWADLSPVGGTKLGPFRARSLALAAEREELERRLSEPLPTTLL